VRLYIKQTLKSSGEAAVIHTRQCKAHDNEDGLETEARNRNTVSLVPIIFYLSHGFYELFCAAGGETYFVFFFNHAPFVNSDKQEVRLKFKESIFTSH
jgi:hypothetical protein